MSRHLTVLCSLNGRQISAQAESNREAKHSCVRSTAGGKLATKFALKSRNSREQELRPRGISAGRFEFY